MAISRDVTTTVRRRARGAARRLRVAGRVLVTGQGAPAGAEAAEVTAVPAQGSADPVYFGWTRYSAHFTDDKGLAFKASKRFKDESAYLDHLWSPERMTARDQIFLDLAVPVLQRWTERHDYRHVVTYSPEMPEPWIGRLRAAAERYPVLSLHPVEDGGINEIVRRTLEAERPGSRPVVWLRVDDDDLLSLDFIDVLDGHVRSHGPGWAVSLSKGLEAVYHEGRVTHLRGRHYVLGALGQAVVGSWDAEQGTLDLPRPGNHMTVDTRLPTVLDSRRATFAYLKHTGQDSRTTKPPTIEELVATHLRNTAVVRHPHNVLPRFPTLADVYDPEG
ncbi:glycosyltransferase [Ornithinimicrobium pekingense]|nr:glycosyltransferase [Ornithinimicrobium pekingense]